ncbi:MAG: hypothetical protein U1E48_04215 [Paracoccaceae bacterium]
MSLIKQKKSPFARRIALWWVRASGPASHAAPVRPYGGKTRRRMGA